MCLGIPMQVVEVGEGHALCRQGDRLRRIDTLLVGHPEPGDWLLTFLDTAREVISAEHARQVLDALQALEMAMAGQGGFDHLFSDLVESRPRLPDFAPADISGKARRD
jgi:hydrogenase assembly chaperone HypC/HupF